MSLDDEEWEWDLSAEELDTLERDALLKFAAKPPPPPPPTPPPPSPSQQQQPHSSHFNNNNHYFDRSPSNPIASSYSSNRVEQALPISPRSKVLPSSIPSKPNFDEPLSKPKASVKFFLHATGNIAAKFLYDQVLVAAFRKIPKASWNAKERLWIFPISSLSSAEKVLSEIPGYNVEVEDMDPLVHRAIAAASAVPDLRDRYDRMPSFIESKLLPFQRDGVRFVLQHGGRVLLADEMGLGKTLQAIAVSACIRDSWPVLILTPSSLRLHWASTIQQWLNIPPSDMLVVLSQCGGSNRAGYTIVSSSTKGCIRLDGLFNIISYDVVPKLQNLLMASEFKVVIADESHFLKNAQAKRTTASVPVIKKAKYAILLSGTPALSRPIELFKQLEALYPDVYKNVHEYGNRYCKGGIFGIYQGASNHEELHNLIKATVMIRRLKKDVLTELPVKRRQQVFLELAEKDMKQINALFCELEVVKGKIKACQSKEEVDSLKFNEKNLINKIYTSSAEAKIPAVLDYLGTVIEAGCKFLIFAHHQPMIDSIYQFLLKKKVGCIRIDGSTPAASRQALVTDFQEKDATRAAVLSIKAGGVGLTLTAASTVIFAELSWTPGDLIQAEDRAHRIGQVSAVNIYYLLANDTVDDIIWDVVQSKLENLGQMLDGHEKTLEVSSSQTSSSPLKQKVSSSQTSSSPLKQKTLDSYMKRCSNMDDLEHQPKLKHPRH
ncbi:SWI/SNF-related matrix-associated actin-dependent regulator of chromatin subfamily A-like protein 1 isoform X1 [Quercus lobata]|uniref:SWI/SNF-related matrix-associated actin-dependent regulator of chromatin subfamily A-like protein 1 isoform X1 n=1 Tax=Quercus lobata TaxID=97700 RepID=UPI001244768C|nr:SWI/SNF-related matrix-associated actin-dependent regulator of chromatin subfamily A-like protein 1 isoform X1 [Quercus lobata]